MYVWSDLCMRCTGGERRVDTDKCVGVNQLSSSDDEKNFATRSSIEPLPSVGAAADDDKEMRRHTACLLLLLNGDACV